jgi:beta-phosphoglucomutase
MKIKGLIFDLDGVLVSTEHNHFVAWQQTANVLGIPFSETDNEALKGVSRIDSLKKILELGKATLNDAQFNAHLEQKNNFYLDSIQNLTKEHLLKGVSDLLNDAKRRGLKLAVGSSSKNAKHILKLVGIIDYFDTIVDGNDVLFPKPHPEVFLKGASILGCHPNECIVFEDAISGIEAAKDGGFIAFGVGNPSLKPFANYYLDDLTQFKLDDDAKLI